MNAATFFEKRRKPFWVIAGVVLVIILGIIDYISGYELNISLFYLIPIFMVVWYTDGQMGLVFSFASTVAWVHCGLFRRADLFQSFDLRLEYRVAAGLLFGGRLAGVHFEKDLYRSTRNWPAPIT